LLLSPPDASGESRNLEREETEQTEVFLSVLCCLGDARTIARAKRANGSKPRIPCAQVKKELQLD
jgi:hypothetical protein